MLLKKFSTYLLESEDFLEKIKVELNSMSADEVDEFGNYIFDFYIGGFEDDETEEEIEPSEPSETYELITVEEIVEIIKSFPVEVLSDVYDDLTYDVEDDETIDETVKRHLVTNKNRRKFMGKDRTDLRREATARRLKNRLNKSERKLYYKKNKANIIAYHREYYRKLKAGKHFKKIRKRT